MARDSKELVRLFIEGIWNRREFNLIDELMTAEYLHHDPQTLGGVLRGQEEYKQFVHLYINAFPDVRLTIEDEISSGETAVIRWTATGTHQGDLPGLPRTGKALTIAGITIARVKGGKFVESWNVWDALGMMRQLGAFPADARGRAA